MLLNVNVTAKQYGNQVQGSKRLWNTIDCGISVVFTNNTFSNSLQINLAKNTNVDYGIKMLFIIFKI